MPDLLYFMKASEIASYSATVATGSGATDADYTDDWICDTRPGRPARATSGSVRWDASFSSSEVGLIVVANCNADVNASITGGASTTVTAGAAQGNGIRLNGFATITPASLTGLNVGFSGAASAVVLGEFIFGKYRTLTRPVYSDDATEVTDFARPHDMDLASIPPYDPGLVARVWSGTYIVTTANKNEIVDWYLSQRGGTRPSVVIPEPTVNDAWVGFLQKPSFSPVSGFHWSVTLTFAEVPRVRW